MFMNFNINPLFMRFVRNVLIIIIITKAISLALLWFFDAEGIDHHESHSKIPEYKRYSAQNLIQATQKVSIKEATEQSPEALEVGSYGENISNMILKGLFKRGDGGVVIIALKAKPKNSEVLGIGEIFEGYTLRKILKNGAVFSKGGSNYSLYFSEEKQQQRYNTKSPQNIQTDDGGIKTVSKDDITFYAKNVDKIWKDIGIVEVKKAGKITGFKVTRIKAGSPFAKLGLRRGDIIIRANNKPMTSYKEAIAIYKGIDKLEALELIVLRNNQETEIVYEIN